MPPEKNIASSRPVATASAAMSGASRSAPTSPAVFSPASGPRRVVRTAVAGRERGGGRRAEQRATAHVWHDRDHSQPPVPTEDEGRTTCANNAERPEEPRARASAASAKNPERPGPGPGRSVKRASAGAAVHLVAVGGLYREGTRVQRDLVQVPPRAEVSVLLAVAGDPAARRDRVGDRFEVLVPGDDAESVELAADRVLPARGTGVQDVRHVRVRQPAGRVVVRAEA